MSMMTDRERDEALEAVWVGLELDERDDQAIRGRILAMAGRDLLGGLVGEDLVVVQGDGTVDFTHDGRDRGADIIRRHRLGERLLADVLEAADVETGACEFEHVISADVADAVCTLLGHPAECPHSRPIPPGRCCRSLTRSVESIVTPLNEAEVGEECLVAYIRTDNHRRLHKLMSFGIAPGVSIKIHQRLPSYVLQVEQTQLALEEDIVADIHVRRGHHTSDGRRGRHGEGAAGKGEQGPGRRSPWGLWNRRSRRGRDSTG